MTNRIKVGCVIGTRPEVIKMAPVINRLKQKSIDVCVINTAQHRQLLDDMLAIFSLEPDIDMNIMQANQSLAALTGNLFLKLEEVIKNGKFDCILAQGDTTTTLVATQVAFYNKIPFGHVEAGLRSYDLYHPFPEEMNRIFSDRIADWLFAPTDIEKQNLLNEHVPEDKILVTGNTVIDSLYELANKQLPMPIDIDPHKKMILVTLHRRESFGQPVREIFSALLELAKTMDDIVIVYPVHPNPNVKLVAEEMLSAQPNIQLIQPVKYDAFVALMQHAYLIMSDSGGIQEEAPALDKPLLILRELTERPLVVELGMGKLVGHDKQRIVKEATTLLTEPNKYQAMQKHYSPYGDGHSAEKIVNFIIQKLKG